VAELLLELPELLQAEIARFHDIQDLPFHLPDSVCLLGYPVGYTLGNDHQSVDVAVEQVSWPDRHAADLDGHINFANHRVAVGDHKPGTKQMEIPKFPDLSDVAKTRIGYASYRPQRFGGSGHHLSQVAAALPVVTDILHEDNCRFRGSFNSLPQREEAKGIGPAFRGAVGGAGDRVTKHRSRFRKNTLEVISGIAGNPGPDIEPLDCVGDCRAVLSSENFQLFLAQICGHAFLRW
jgi:hypothetical protein